MILCVYSAIGGTEEMQRVTVSLYILTLLQDRLPMSIQYRPPLLTENKFKEHLPSLIFYSLCKESTQLNTNSACRGFPRSS